MAWAPRRSSAAFGIGMDTGSFATEGHYGGKRKLRSVDIENGFHGRPGNNGTELHDLEPIDAAEGSYDRNAALR
jgi:hypothetical protein